MTPTQAATRQAATRQPATRQAAREPPAQRRSARRPCVGAPPSAAYCWRWRVREDLSRMVRPGGEPVLRKRGHAMDGNGSILTKAGISATRGGEETAQNPSAGGVVGRWPPGLSSP